MFYSMMISSYGSHIINMCTLGQKAVLHAVFGLLLDLYSILVNFRIILDNSRHLS